MRRQAKNDFRQYKLVLQKGLLFRGKAKLSLRKQGCSTLFTEGHRKYGFETAESGGVAVLRDCVGLIEPEYIVGEASNSREDAQFSE